MSEEVLWTKGVASLTVCASTANGGDGALDPEASVGVNSVSCCSRASFLLSFSELGWMIMAVAAEGVAVVILITLHRATCLWQHEP